MENGQSILTPPKYCEYSSSECDQSFSNLETLDAFFIYPSQPQHLADSFKECVINLRRSQPRGKWLSWQDLSVSGQIIFCEICKAIRSAKLVVANITSVNFNVLFELGYAIGLRKPVLPFRDSTYESQKKALDEIGVFDTLGFQSFTNSGDIVDFILSKRAFSPPIYSKPELNTGYPIYYLRSPINTDGSIKLFSCLKKSYFRFRSFDIKETPRLSLHEAFKHVLSSLSIVAHLIDPTRAGADSHNARAAFVCGMGLATGKHVLMLQEGHLAHPHPIDYRDIIVPYVEVISIPAHVESIVRETADAIQTIDATHVQIPKKLLERIDLGDIAAENEISALSTYFVKTPQFQQARQGHARIVVGRKGTGKTAMFYGIRNQFSKRGNTLVLDLKPEGHQFVKLREHVLSQLSEGLQLHTLTAFWYYLLILELTNKTLERELKTAYQSAESLALYNQLKEMYKAHTQTQGDFSERLMSLINRLIETLPPELLHKIKSADITDVIYRYDIKDILSKLVPHLRPFSAVWILFDNIDKGFPTHGLQSIDVHIIRCLLEAIRKLQESLETHGIDCMAAIFIRSDVYDHLVDCTPDRGKESYVNLDWSDIELIKELLLRRFRYQAPELEGSFEEVWSRLFDPHVRGESSFNYVVSRTFLRPRDILNFTRKSIQIAVSRNHPRVDQDDITAAEKSFSEDMLNELRYEMRDIFPSLPDIALAFLGYMGSFAENEVSSKLIECGVSEDQLPSVIEILLWFAFLGIKIGENEHYSYQVSYNMAKLKHSSDKRGNSERIYAIHPAFSKALLV